MTKERGRESQTTPIPAFFFAGSERGAAILSRLFSAIWPIIRELRKQQGCIRGIFTEGKSTRWHNLPRK